MQMTIIDGAKYEAELQKAGPGGLLSPEQLESLMLLKTIKAVPEPLLVPESRQHMTNERVLVALQVTPFTLSPLPKQPAYEMNGSRSMQPSCDVENLWEECAECSHGKACQNGCVVCAVASNSLLLALQNGGVPLPGLRLKASSETVLNGKRSPFRLLIRALDLWGRPVNIEPAVSNNFVVRTFSLLTGSPKSASNLQRSKPFTHTNRNMCSLNAAGICAKLLP